MSSVNGRHALPSFSPYNASKYAVETVSDSLRMEMKRFGVKVSLIEPGMFGGSTEIHSEANVSIVKNKTTFRHQKHCCNYHTPLTTYFRSMFYMYLITETSLCAVGNFRIKMVII